MDLTIDIFEEDVIKGYRI